MLSLLHAGQTLMMLKLHLICAPQTTHICTLNLIRACVSPSLPVVLLHSERPTLSLIGSRYEEIWLDASVCVGTGQKSDQSVLFMGLKWCGLNGEERIGRLEKSGSFHHNVFLLSYTIVISGWRIVLFESKKHVTL